ncbi:MAG: arsinothricin resistance N-acetyltransferase ArsN1 [Hyphomonas sp.]
MTGNAILRVARPDDAGDIAAIYAPYVRDTVISFETEAPDEAEMHRRIVATLKTHPWLVAELSGLVVGYAYASQHRARLAYRWGCDVAVYLAPETKGQGIGNDLYTDLLKFLRRQGFRHAFGGIALPNPASVALHERHGFRHLGTYRQVGFKLGAWHDVGWWQLALEADPGPPDEIIPFAELRV